MDRPPRRNGGANRLLWFDKWFLNNKFVTFLLILLLLLINIFVFTKIAYIFQPLGGFFRILGFPLVFAGILYYLMNPIVQWMEHRGTQRMYAIIIVFVVFLLLVVWGIAILIPIFREQLFGIIGDFPRYWRSLNEMTANLFEYEWFSSLQQQFTDINVQVGNALSSWANSILTNTVSGLGNVFGVVTNLVVGLVTMPIILYYLLKEGEKLPQRLLQFMPNRYRQSTGVLLSQVNLQISQYVRGQILVAFSVGIMFTIGYNIIGLQYGFVLGILAGFLNVIPFLGSFLAMVPAVLIAVVDSPFMLLKVLLVFVVEQTIEGRVISPQILGSNLAIHPVTILVVLLTAGNLFGIVGFVLGIPGYAVVKVIFMHIFEWYKEVSGLYPEEETFKDEPILLGPDKKIEDTLDK